MFYYLDGNVTVITENLAVIDIAGAGYACMCTLSTLSRLQTGSRAKLYIYENIKEDSFDLYGFFDLSEKRCFEQLLSVSGVGPKAALSILSSASPEALAIAVLSDDEAILTRAPGVGKKLAARIVLELKDKVSKDLPKGVSASLLPAVDRSGQSGGIVSEVSAALSVLGYTQSEISTALRNIDIAGKSVEEVVRLVLQSGV